MTPRLGLLTQKLNRGVSSTAETDNPQARMMTSYKAEVDRECKAAIKVVEDQLSAAQSEIASLKAQLAEAGKDTTRSVKDYGYKLDSVKEAHKLELDALSNKHNGMMAAVISDLDSAKRECAAECQARVKAETERDGAQRMCAHLEQTVAKLQADLKAKPVLTPGDKKPVSFTTKVSQRDENGRIVSSITTPNY